MSEYRAPQRDLGSEEARESREAKDSQRREARRREEKDTRRKERHQEKQQAKLMATLLKGVELVNGEWTLKTRRSIAPLVALDPVHVKASKKGKAKSPKTMTLGSVLESDAARRTEEKDQLRICEKLIFKAKHAKSDVLLGSTREARMARQHEEARLEQERLGETLRAYVSTKHKKMAKLPKKERVCPPMPPSIRSDDSSVASFVSRSHSSQQDENLQNLQDSTFYNPASILTALGHYERRQILSDDPFGHRYEVQRERAKERERIMSLPAKLEFGAHMGSGGVELYPAMDVKAQRRKDTEDLFGFYNALGGPQWVKDSGWPTYQYFDPYTPRRNMYVHEAINMHGCLTKIFSQNLVEIRLARNRLSGPFPNNIIGDMLKLEKLDITDNHVTGHLEDYTFGRLKHLRVICLHGNKLTGELPGGGLMRLLHLHELTMSKNCLSGPIPASIDCCSNLTHLCLFSNRLSGHIPESICFLKRLKALLLHDNCLIGPVPQRLATIETLQVISLYKNCLTGTVPKALATMSNLKELLLSRNRLRGFVPESVAHMHDNLHLLEDKVGLDLLPMGEAAECEPEDNDLCGLLQKPWTQRDFLVAESLASGNKWLVAEPPPNI